MARPKSNLANASSSKDQCVHIKFQVPSPIHAYLTVCTNTLEKYKILKKNAKPKMAVSCKASSVWQEAWGTRVWEDGTNRANCRTNLRTFLVATFLNLLPTLSPEKMGRSNVQLCCLFTLANHHGSKQDNKTYIVVYTHVATTFIKDWSMYFFLCGKKKIKIVWTADKVARGNRIAHISVHLSQL